MVQISIYSETSLALRTSSRQTARTHVVPQPLAVTIYVEINEPLNRADKVVTKALLDNCAGASH